ALRKAMRAQVFDGRDDDAYRVDAGVPVEIPVLGREQAFDQVRLLVCEPDLDAFGRRTGNQASDDLGFDRGVFDRIAAGSADAGDGSVLDADVDEGGTVALGPTLEPAQVDLKPRRGRPVLARRLGHRNRRIAERGQPAHEPAALEV